MTGANGFPRQQPSLESLFKGYSSPPFIKHLFSSTENWCRYILMILKEIIYRQQLFLMGPAFKILSFSLLPIFWVNEEISFQNQFLLLLCRKSTSAKTFWIHLCNHLSSSVLFLHWVSSVPHKVQPPVIMVWQLICYPVIMSYEILLVFSYHISSHEMLLLNW